MENDIEQNTISDEALKDFAQELRKLYEKYKLKAEKNKEKTA